MKETVRDQICADGLQTHVFNLLLHVVVTSIHLLPPQHLHGHVHGVGGHVGREAALQRNLGSIWPVGESHVHYHKCVTLEVFLKTAQHLLIVSAPCLSACDIAITNR